MMVDFDPAEHNRQEIENAALLIVICVLGFLAAFAFIVVQIYKWIGG